MAEGGRGFGGVCEWIFSNEWWDGKFIYSCLCWVLLVLRKGLRRGKAADELQKEMLQSADRRSEDKLKVLMRGSTSLNLRFANMQSTLQVLYLLWAEQLVQQKMSGLIVYPPNFDSWETPKAPPEATASISDSSRVALWIFAVVH